VWPYCTGYGERSIRKGHVVAEVNWSGGRAWVHAYHLEQLGVRFAPTEEDRRRQLEMDARAVRRGFRLASEVLRICRWRSPQVVMVLIEGQGISFAGRKASARSVRSCGLPPTTIACSSAGLVSGGRTSLS
jgi:hypothetical protein